MDYTELAQEFLHSMDAMRKAKFQKGFSQRMRGEIFILQYMAKNGGLVQPSEVCQEMSISSARVTAALNSLESKGLVTREIDKSDRRRILTKLTPAGKELADTHRQNHVEDAVSMLRLLGEHDAREYVRLTRKLAHLTSQAPSPELFSSACPIGRSHPSPPASPSVPLSKKHESDPP